MPLPKFMMKYSHYEDEVLKIGPLMKASNHCVEGMCHLKLTLIQLHREKMN